MREELFIPVKSLDEKYAVSEKGTVKNIKRNVVLQGSRGKPGYKVIHYYRGKKLIQRYFHHLVLEAFAKGLPKSLVTNHKDGNKLNNQLENLEIVTHKENAQHANITGLCQKSDNRPNTKVLDKDLIKIKQLREQGLLYKDIAEIYGCSRHLISYICRETRRA